MHRYARRFALVALALLAPVAARAQTAGDRAGVERAALDYLETFYEGDSTKALRSIRPDVRKYGFSIRDGTRAYAGRAMSFQQMLDYARDVRTTGDGKPPANATKKVALLDVQDQTAAAKVTAWWGTDYLHLAKFDGRWMIVHVMWQTAPKI